MDKRFLSAYIDPAPFRLLGRSLYPWCLKYRVRLEAFQSPLIDGSRDITPADLILALKLCAEEPIGKFGICDSWRVIRLERDTKEFQRLLEAFSKYVLVSHWPKFWEQSKAKGDTSKGIPFPLAIVANLIANGIEEKRAWEMPECQAIWMNTAFGVRNGAEVSVMSPEEEALMNDAEMKEAAEAAFSNTKQT
jgi:hypothetical protein